LFFFFKYLKRLVTSIDGDRDWSDGSNCIEEIRFRSFLDVDESGASRADVLLLEKTFAAASGVRVRCLRKQTLFGYLENSRNEFLAAIIIILLKV
jgi:hypothetical protein